MDHTLRTLTPHELQCLQLEELRAIRGLLEDQLKVMGALVQLAPSVEVSADLMAEWAGRRTYVRPAEPIKVPTLRTWKLKVHPWELAPDLSKVHVVNDYIAPETNARVIVYAGHQIAGAVEVEPSI